MISLHPVDHNDEGLFAGSSYEAMPSELMHDMIDESLSKMHNGSFFELLAVMVDAVCVGFVSLYEHSGTEISCGPEIKPQYRKRGFAYSAVNCALEYARQIGYVRVVAQVRQDNTASIALHRKLGFSVCGEYINQKGNPVFWFEKNL